MLLMADKFMGRKERQEKEENELNNRFKKKRKTIITFRHDQTSFEGPIPDCGRHFYKRPQDD